MSNAAGLVARLDADEGDFHTAEILELIEAQQAEIDKLTRHLNEHETALAKARLTINRTERVVEAARKLTTDMDFERARRQAQEIRGSGGDHWIGHGRVRNFGDALAALDEQTERPEG